MELFTLRLHSDQDLRLEIMAFANANNILAGSIVTCVGSLKTFSLRMAGATPNNQNIKNFNQTHEIVSLVGTLSGKDCHLHIALSNKNGDVIGGHLKQGSLIDTTAEIVIMEDTNKIYSRNIDQNTKFSELAIEPR